MIRLTGFIFVCCLLLGSVSPVVSAGNCPSNQWINAENGSGNAQCAQPASTNLSDIPANAAGVLTNNGAGTFSYKTGEVVLDQQAATPSVGTCNQLTAADTDIISNGTGCTSETTFYVYSVPGGTLGTNHRIKVEFWGDYLNNSGSSDTINIRAKYGGTLLASIGGSNALTASASRRPIEGQVNLSAEGATNAQEAFGRFTVGGAVGGGGAGGAQAFVYSGQQIASTVDSTSAQTLYLSITLTTSNSNIEFRVLGVTVTVL